MSGFFLGVAASSLLAQCDFNVLDDASAHFAVGQFEQVKGHLRPCLADKGFTTREATSRAWRWLALVALAQDSLEVAEECVHRILKNDPSFQSEPHLMFDRLFEQLSDRYLQATVVAVSKRAEDIRTAPAHVELVTREDIMARGYMDLIDLLSDIPGFDISRVQSTTYANFYQLGFRQENPEHTLLMIDGVEENDVWSNISYISRQYPLSNIKAVEIVYGPSSTMYGPRAFVGAINILTLGPGERPADLLQRRPSGGPVRPFFLYGQASVGRFRTMDTDLTMGWSGKALKVSFSGRYFYSDEEDLSFESFYNYDPDDFRGLSYSHLNMGDTVRLWDRSDSAPIARSLHEYLDYFQLPWDSPYYETSINASGQVDSLWLTPAGVEWARQRDSAVYLSMVNGRPAGYSNHSQNLFLSGRMSFSNFTLGFSTWRREEGFNYYLDVYSPGSRNGSLWVPQNSTLFARYHRSFENWTVSNLMSFHDHGLDRRTNQVLFNSFALPSSGLHLAHLFLPDTLLPGNRLSGMVRHGYANNYYYYQAQQFRNDFRLLYQRRRWVASMGAEFRSSIMPGDYLIYRDYDVSGERPPGQAYAQENGLALGQKVGSNLFSIWDAGVYAQASYGMWKDRLHLSGGIRVDHNRIRASDGFGTVSSPRIALMWVSKYVSAKLIYSRGLQNVSQWVKYSTSGGRIPNPDLETEKVEYLNFSLLGQNGRGNLRWSLSGYNCFVSDVVASGTHASGASQNQNIGAFYLAGAMWSLEWSLMEGGLRFYLNHSMMAPFQTASEDPEIFDYYRVGDIAGHRANAGLTWRMKMGPWTVLSNVRANAVSERPVGPETTQTRNAGLDNSFAIPAYLIFNGALHVGHRDLPWLRISLIGNNLLNDNILDPDHQRYYHPGARAASGSASNISGNVPYVPQRSRMWVLRTTLDF